jgi:hypothetical protein
VSPSEGTRRDKSLDLSGGPSEGTYPPRAHRRMHAGTDARYGTLTKCSRSTWPRDRPARSHGARARLRPSNQDTRLREGASVRYKSCGRAPCNMSCVEARARPSVHRAPPSKGAKRQGAPVRVSRHGRDTRAGPRPALHARRSGRKRARPSSALPNRSTRVVHRRPQSPSPEAAAGRNAFLLNSCSAGHHRVPIPPRQLN